MPASFRISRFAFLARTVCGALLSGALLGIAFPPLAFWPLAWIGLIPLLVALRDCSGGYAFLLSWSSGSVFFAIVCQWLLLPDAVQIRDFLMFTLCFGLWFGVFGLGYVLFVRGRRSPVFLACATAALWVGIEYVRGHVDAFSLPWGLLAYSQVEWLSLIQISAVTGAYGVSFFIVLVNVMLAECIRCRRLLYPPVCVGIVCLTLLTLWGRHILTASPVSYPVSVGIVPGHIPQDTRWQGRYAYDVYATGTAQLASLKDSSSIDLVVWPETAVQTSAIPRASYPRSLNNLARMADAALLVGMAERAKFQAGSSSVRARHNTALWITPDGTVTSRYHKIRLFPFGEYVPYRHVLPWPARARRSGANMVPGDEYTTFPLTTRHGSIVPVSALICWESAFPDLVRAFVQRGARLFVNMTNEAWFSGRGFPEQFLQVNVFRAIEHGVSVVRAANLGLSGIIDSHGRVVEVMGFDQPRSDLEKVLVADVPVNNIQTVYTQYGDMFMGINILGLLVLVGWVRWKTGQVQRGEARDSHPPQSQVAGNSEVI